MPARIVGLCSLIGSSLPSPSVQVPRTPRQMLCLIFTIQTWNPPNQLLCFLLPAVWHPYPGTKRKPSSKHYRTNQTLAWVLQATTSYPQQPAWLYSSGHIPPDFSAIPESAAPSHYYIVTSGGQLWSEMCRNTPLTCVPGARPEVSGFYNIWPSLLALSPTFP